MDLCLDLRLDLSLDLWLDQNLMFQEAAKDRERLKEVETECRLLKDRLNR